MGNSLFAPSVVVLSLTCKVLDFIFASPSTTIKCELDSARVSKVRSNLSVSFSKPSLVSLGHRQRETNLHILEPTCNSKLILSCK